MTIRWSAGARHDAQVAAAWWTLHRPAAPRRLREELDRALALIESAPLSGQPYRSGTRRLLLRKSRYWLIYEVRDSAVEIHSLWSTRRGEPPPLEDER